MSTLASEIMTEEEKLVAELELLGVRYLSRQTTYQAHARRDPATLLADLIRQPSARVRGAMIAVLLAHPVFAEVIPSALERLEVAEQLTLKLFYMAAVLIQQKHAERFRRFVASNWRWLPDLFSGELGLPFTGPPDDRLAALGHAHARLTNTVLNWRGTYESVAEHLLRRWELERRWSR